MFVLSIKSGVNCSRVRSLLGEGNDERSSYHGKDGKNLMLPDADSSVPISILATVVDGKVCSLGY